MAARFGLWGGLAAFVIMLALPAPAGFGWPSIARGSTPSRCAPSG